MIADNDADDLDVRKALAEQHLAAGHADQAEKWATECLYIDVYDPASHVLLADALAARKKYARGHRGVPDRPRPQAQEAERPQGQARPRQADFGQRDAAKATLDDILKADPEHPEAKALRKEIDGKGTNKS